MSFGGGVVEPGLVDAAGRGEGVRGLEEFRPVVESVGVLFLVGRIEQRGVGRGRHEGVVGRRVVEISDIHATGRGEGVNALEELRPVVEPVHAVGLNSVLNGAA